MRPDQMKVGSFYHIQHKRKGGFYGRYMGPSGREDHSVFDILTWPGHGQEKLANSRIRAGNTKTTPVWSQKALSDSLCEYSTPSTAAQKEWVERAKGAEEEFAHLSGTETKETYSTTVEPEPVEIPEMPKKPGFFRRIFGGK